jgi:AraC-like DNA-binding protein
MRVWTTNTLPFDQQFPFWREVLCEAFTTLDPIVPRESWSRPFSSTVAKKDLLGVAVTDGAAPAQRIVHGEAEIRRMRDDVFFLNMQLSGDLVTQQDNRTARTRPGEFCLVDSTRPYQLDFDDWHTLSIRIPRHLLLPGIKRPETITAIRLGDDGGGMGTVLSTYLRTLANCPDGLSPSAQEGLVQSLIHLLTATITPASPVSEDAKECVRAQLRETIVAYVETHIASPNLNTNSVARSFGVSPRYLQKLFEGAEYTFAETVTRARLQRVATELRCTASRQSSISEIAYRWGFLDFSSFCRAFRRRYGLSATEFRGADTVSGISQDRTLIELAS